MRRRWWLQPARRQRSWALVTTCVGPPCSASRVLVLHLSDAASVSRQAITVLGLHHDVPDARTRTVLTPVLGALQCCAPRVSLLPHPFLPTYVQHIWVSCTAWT